MKWEVVLKTLRTFREKGIPIELGANAFLLSPWLPSKNDDGWRLRMLHKSVMKCLNQLESTVDELGLDIKYQLHNDTAQYIEIFQSRYCDPIHMDKLNGILPGFPIVSKNTPTS